MGDHSSIVQSNELDGLSTGAAADRPIRKWCQERKHKCHAMRGGVNASQTDVWLLSLPCGPSGQRPERPQGVLLRTVNGAACEWG
jgi:hypothetical protein